MTHERIQRQVIDRATTPDWWIYDERQWLDNIIEFNQRQLQRLKIDRAEMDARIDRWENYLKTGK